MSSRCCSLTDFTLSPPSPPVKKFLAKKLGFLPAPRENPRQPRDPFLFPRKPAPPFSPHTTCPPPHHEKNFRARRIGLSSFLSIQRDGILNNSESRFSAQSGVILGRSRQITAGVWRRRRVVSSCRPLASFGDEEICRASRRAGGFLCRRSFSAGRKSFPGRSLREENSFRETSAWFFGIGN